MPDFERQLAYNYAFWVHQARIQFKQNSDLMFVFSRFFPKKFQKFEINFTSRNRWNQKRSQIRRNLGSVPTNQRSSVLDSTNYENNEIHVTSCSPYSLPTYQIQVFMFNVFSLECSLSVVKREYFSSYSSMLSLQIGLGLGISLFSKKIELALCDICVGITTSEGIF